MKTDRRRAALQPHIQPVHALGNAAALHERHLMQVQAQPKGGILEEGARRALSLDARHLRREALDAAARNKSLERGARNAKELRKRGGGIDI